MAENQSKVAELQGTATAQLKEKDYKSSLNSAIDKLSKLGGFGFLESSVDGVQNLNPERKARKNIFLTDEQKKGERKALANKLDMWIQLLDSTKDINEMLDKAKDRSNVIGEHLEVSQLKAVETVKNLEQSYRGVMLFYKNTEAEKVSNVTIVNASKEQIGDLDNSRFIDFVAQELKQNYDKLDLKMNYSLLGLPGYLGSNKVVEKWSKIVRSRWRVLKC